MEWAAEHGIVSGVGNSQFAPNASVTREQMTVMLHHYIQHKGFSLNNKAGAGGFNDSGTISSWAADSVGIFQRAGIISGKPGNVFDPQGMSTRAEVSAILARFISELVQ
ncbi:Endoglucanase precursor [compost metagenome]